MAPDAYEYSDPAKYSFWSTIPGVTPRPWGPAAHSGIGASCPWLESGEPMLDEVALAMLRLEDGTRMSLLSSP
jgi:hypothetical protein